MSEFTDQARKITDDLLEHDPILATFAGVHDYDAHLPDLTVDGFAERADRARKHVRSVNRFAADALDRDDRTDRELLTSRFEVELRELEELEPQHHDPSLYPQTAVEGVYTILLRDYAPLAKRLPDIVSRVKKIPAAVSAGETNLKEAPRVWLETALDETQGGAAFLRQTLEPLRGQDAELGPALQTALGAFDRYEGFLKQKLAAADGMPFAIGRELFDFKLRREHLLPYDADSLLAFGDEMVRTTSADLEQVAGQIESGAHWAALVEQLRKDHPDAEELLDEYRRGLAKVRAFVEQRRLVSIPDGEQLEIVETPLFLQPTLPYAAYQMPGPFEKRQVGAYYVTPVNQKASPEAQRDQLMGHNRYGMLLTNVHEGYPGHHLQLVHANRHPSPVRRLLGNSSVFCEGWALYCEQMVLDERLDDDPRTRLFQLKDQLWRACRVVTDVKLHTGAFTFEQAVDYMVQVAHLERFNAIGEVRRYTHTPTQPMSYLVGKHQILDCRERQRTRLGSAFDLRAFHDRLLSFGSIPLALVEPALAG